MVLMLLYSVRKRVAALRRLGALSRWLDVHIFLGVFGPLLVVLHSGFKVQGLVALSFWSMIVVAVERCPGPLPVPADSEDARRRGAGARRDREAGPRAVAAAAQRASASTTPSSSASTRSSPCPERSGLVSGFARMLLGQLRLRAALAEFARGCRGVPRPLYREFERVVQQKALARRRILLWDRAHELFHYWHVMHKPFALVMYLFMVVHVAVAARRATRGGAAVTGATASRVRCWPRWRSPRSRRARPRSRPGR